MAIMVLTGAPGVGKTTAMMNAARALSDMGIKVGGIVSREIRTNNMRTGFEFVDLATNDTNIMASIVGRGPKIGKYFVNLEGCLFAAERLTGAVKNSDVIICDELGPMEIKSKQFISSVTNLLDVQKKVMIVIHQKLQHPLTIQFRKRSRLLISLDLGNREKINGLLVAALSDE